MKQFVLLLVLSLLIVTTVASAQNPDKIVITSDKSAVGLIANGHDSAIITVYVYEGPNPVPDILVTFSGVNSTLGTLTPLTAMTDGDGRATTTLTAGTQAGIAEVRAENSSITNTTTLQIVAPIPDESSYIESNTEWLIANNSDRATISVYAYNTSPSYANYPLSGLQVQFGMNSSIYGSFTPVTAVTNSAGLAQSTFKTNYRSGTALLYGNLTYILNGEPAEKRYEVLQKIDHDTPYRIFEYNYTYRVDVGEETSILLAFLDRWGNPIDNRRVTEEVKFVVSSPSALPKGAGFINGSDYTQEMTVPVTAAGKTEIILKTDEVPGWNYVTVKPLMYTVGGEQAITEKSIVVAGVPGKPVRIVAEFTPPDFRLPADGVSVFHITYTLWDKFDNYVQNRSVMVETSIPGEGKTVGTNPQGQAVLQYGPKWSIGMVEITATALDNTSVTHTQQVWFVPQEPADVLFTVSPQTMPSREIPNRDSTWLIATIVDESGNPVNESVEVSFGFSGVTYDKIYDITSNPEIPVSTALTDEYGIAMVEFLPGGFNSSNQTPATGRCDVFATWGGITRTVPVVWKNYPYLSVEAYASSNLVQVNDTVDITVLLKGDGYKLLPPPIDVVLCTDRSGSMLFDNPDRMHSIREAAKVFVDEFSASRDRIGMVTFGRNGYISRPGYNSGISTSEIHNVYNPWSRTYSGYATYDRVLTNDFIDVKRQLDRILPDHGTPMREAARLSTRTLITSGRSNAVKAVVLLSDGDYNWYGDPLARGNGYTGYGPTDYGDLTQHYYYYTSLTSSNQNMSNYARNNNIKIYSIAFANSISPGGKQTLQTLALGTGGKYYEASATDIQDVYRAIAGDLKTEAGVNTTMDLNYEKIIVNYTTEEVNDPLNPIFNYNYSYGHSTWINSYMTDGSALTIPGLPWNFDNSSEWAATRKLSFTLGTVHLYQVWEIRYRLVACQEGIFNLFGPQSQINFEGADEPLIMPDLFLKVNPEISDTPIENIELYYTQIEQNSSSSSPHFYVTFDINHTYTGVNNVKEDYYIVTYDGRRHYLGSDILPPDKARQNRTYTVLISRLPTGWSHLEPVLTEIGWEAPGPIIPVTPLPINRPSDSGGAYINLT